MRKLSVCLVLSLVLTALTGCYPPPAMEPTAGQAQQAPHVDLSAAPAPAEPA